MKIDTEAGLQKLPDETEVLIEVSCLQRVVDLVGAMKRLHRALRTGGKLLIVGPLGSACWDDPKAKRQVNAETFKSFGRNSKDDALPHFFTVTAYNGGVELIK